MLLIATLLIAQPRFFNLFQLKITFLLSLLLTPSTSDTSPSFHLLYRPTLCLAYIRSWIRISGLSRHVTFLLPHSTLVTQEGHFSFVPISFPSVYHFYFQLNPDRLLYCVQALLCYIFFMASFWGYHICLFIPWQQFSVHNIYPSTLTRWVWQQIRLKYSSLFLPSSHFFLVSPLYHLLKEVPLPMLQ